MTRTALVWFTNDLRLSDNQVLHEAAALPIIPIYIINTSPTNPWPIGRASRWWLTKSLLSLKHDLKAKGVDLIIFEGDPTKIIPKLCKSFAITDLYYHEAIEPFLRRQQDDINMFVSSHHVSVHSYRGHILFDHKHLRTKQGKPYQVYTPFYHALKALPIPADPLPSPTHLKCPENITGLSSAALSNEPHWAKGFNNYWHVGEQAAQQRLSEFCEEGLAVYTKNRDIPSLEGTSRLSPHLHFGEISIRQIYVAVSCALERLEIFERGERFLMELAWREFAYYQLHYHPESPLTCINQTFANFPWETNQPWLKQWQQGQTGFPIVDAGMRELWQTGTMHNRVRMIVGSFLVKDLMIPWQEGAKWFWDTLLDADLANNTMNWQWVAGCGVDAAPFFRIFNPALQTKRFDPEGLYIKHFVPELKHLPPQALYEPHRTSALILNDANVQLGKNYPYPMIDHDLARNRALIAYRMSRR